MNDKLFISQDVLGKWVDAGKVKFDGDTLALLQEKKTYTLTPAVRFMSLLAGEDAGTLLGKVRTLGKLKELGAEHLSDSVLLGDIAYQVQEGFVAIVLADAEVAAAPETPKAVVPVAAPAPVAPVAAPPVPAPPQESVVTPATETADAELLTKFLLNNINF